MPKTCHVLIELGYSQRVARHAAAAAVERKPGLDTKVVPRLGPLTWDEEFAAVALPALEPRDQSDDPFDTAPLRRIVEDPEQATFLVRGSVEEDGLPELEESCRQSRAVAGVWSDVAIAPQIVCPGSAPVGDDGDVERLLCTPRLREEEMDGRGVLVAVVDSGVSMNYLASRGKSPGFDAGRSWAWTSGLTPGSMPVSHGTMVAFDVCIAAPRCTILDIALLHPVSGRPGGTIMESLLSDAIRAYRHLLDVMNAPRRPGENRWPSPDRGRLFPEQAAYLMGFLAACGGPGLELEEDGT